jgi:predicted SprT family Zn-dependent metalloprotease
VDEPIDLEKHRKKKRGPDEAYLYFCECGCSLFHTWSNGVVQCVNCRGELSLTVLEIE